MGLVIFESCIIEPRPSRSRRQNRKVSQTTPPTDIIRGTVTECPREERGVLVVNMVGMIMLVHSSRDPSFHVCQRSQPIIFLDETRPSCTCGLHQLTKIYCICVVLKHPLFFFFLVFVFWGFFCCSCFVFGV